MKKSLRNRSVARCFVAGALATLTAQIAPWSLASAQAADGCNDIAQGRCFVHLSTGIDLAYIETGPKDGNPVILIHGLTDSIRSWSLAMDDLRQLDPKLHIFAVDLRGHGGSSMPAQADCASAPETCFQVRALADDIVAFMKAEQISRATLVGHSLGSMVVQDVALDHPELVDHAVLVATTSRVKDNAALRDYVLNEPVEGSWKKALQAKGKAFPNDVYMLTPADADPNAEDWIAKNWDVDPAADASFLKPYIPETAKVHLGTWIGATKAALQIDNNDRLKDLAVPTLVMWGSQDNIFLPQDQEAIKSALSQAVGRHGITAYWKQYGSLPLPASGPQETDIGHNVQWAAHQTVAADIDAFIRSGKPTSDLAHSDKAPNINKILIETGKAAVIQIGKE